MHRACMHDQAAMIESGLTLYGSLSVDYTTPTSGQHPTLLAPIVLGSAIKNPKIVSLAVSALQRLTSIPGAIVEVRRVVL